MGTIHGGHYVGYVKKENNSWYCVNDERVGKVSKEEALLQDAYLLFYTRVISKWSIRRPINDW